MNKGANKRRKNCGDIGQVAPMLSLTAWDCTSNALTGRHFLFLNFMDCAAESRRSSFLSPICPSRRVAKPVVCGHLCHMSADSGNLVAGLNYHVCLPICEPLRTLVREVSNQSQTKLKLVAAKSVPEDDNARRKCTMCALCASPPPIEIQPRITPPPLLFSSCSFPCIMAS